MDAIDKAFFRALKHYPRAKELFTTYRCIQFTPFDPVSKKVVAIVESQHGELMTCVKGAPSAVLKMIENESTVSSTTILECQATITKFAARGFRSLAVARRTGKLED